MIQLKFVIGQAGHPLGTSSINLGHCQDIDQRIVVCIDIIGQSIKVFVEFLTHSPFEGEKFQFVGRVMRFSLCQAPTSIGKDSIHTIIISVVEDSPQTRPASIGMEFKRPGEIFVGKNTCHAAWAL